MKIKLSVCCILLFSFILAACVPAGQKVITASQLIDRQYDSEFPQKPASPYLEHFARTIKLVSSLTFYRTYEFSLEQALTLKDVSAKDFNAQQKAQHSAIAQRPSSGTAVLISVNGNYLTLLTCAHIVHEPDTLLYFYQDKNQQSSPFVQSMSIKSKQNISIPLLPPGGAVRILALNRKNDLALLGIKLNSLPKLPLAVLDVKWGRAARLKWGSFVYLLGFPNGKKMVTSALVSEPNRDKQHNFLVDANLPQGISGGIVLALRDGVPYFELVGIANALSGREEFVLRPDPLARLSQLARNLPYTGDIYVGTQMSPVSGITYAIGIENAKELIEQHRGQIERMGYSLPSFKEAE